MSYWCNEEVTSPAMSERNISYVSPPPQKSNTFKLDWSVCICLTQLYDSRDMCRIYYIKNNYMFRHFTLAIFRLRNEKNLSKQLYSAYVGCIQWGGKG